MMFKIGLILSSPAFAAYSIHASAAAFISSPSSRHSVMTHSRRYVSSSRSSIQSRAVRTTNMAQSHRTTTLAASILNFDPSISTINDSLDLHIIGRKRNLESYPQALLPSNLSPSIWNHLVSSTSAGTSGNSACTLYTTNSGDGDVIHRLYVHVLPETISRHNTPLRSHAVTELLSKAPTFSSNQKNKDDDDDDNDKEEKKMDVMVLVDDPNHCSALACAIARCFPLYNAKSKSSSKSTTNIRFIDASSSNPSCALITDSQMYQHATNAANGVRLASRIVDTPPAEMNVNQFVKEAQQIQSSLDGVDIEIIRGEELKERGYGGIYGVGKAGIEPPALVILTKTFSENTEGEVVALVGKGIVYDTGGLSLKISGGMCGMKSDCGGAAGLLGAFAAACQNGVSSSPDGDDDDGGGGKGVSKLMLVLCLAENSISQSAFRNDDILKFKSGRTCEINNTDAEGRLVLADGVSHATLKCDDDESSSSSMPDLVLDMATLTGAQMVSTGRKHAAIVSNCEQTEIRAVLAGKQSGDLVHPLMYVPEFTNAEFESKVADSKNSVKDRMNAQASCAAQFVGNNLSQEFLDAGGKWLHVDMAGPSVSNERGTGYGVALVLSLLNVNGFSN